MSISPEEPTSPANNAASVTSPFFYPTNPSPLYIYFSPPPIYFITETNLAPPPSIYVYYPLWCVNPNYSIQELPTLHSPTPSVEVPPRLTKRGRFFGRRSYRYGKKAMWRKKIEHQAESNADQITTLMLRNIPNKYTREMMIEFMDEYCEEANENKRNDESPVSAYDFFYLPIDFGREMNKGYAFVNFTNTEAASEFKAACNYMTWSHFSSRKILKIDNARIQGKDELVSRFRQMTYPNEEYGAVSFSPARSGSKSTVETIMVGKCNEQMISV